MSDNNNNNSNDNNNNNRFVSSLDKLKSNIGLLLLNIIVYLTDNVNKRMDSNKRIKSSSNDNTINNTPTNKSTEDNSHGKYRIHSLDKRSDC